MSDRLLLTASTAEEMLREAKEYDLAKPYGGITGDVLEKLREDLATTQVPKEEAIRISNQVHSNVFGE